MSVICSKCGCADVLCEAMINPNTKVFENYTDESFLYGWCNVCQTGRTLTDVEDVKAIIDNNFSKFCEKNGCEPGYVICTIVWKDDNGCEEVKIKMSSDSRDDDDFFFYCDSLTELKALCDCGGEDFIIIGGTIKYFV